MQAFTKTDICNMALSNLGLANNVTNIDEPSAQTEKVFAQFYDMVVVKLLKRERPQFAIYEEDVPATIWADGSYHYMVPSYALEVMFVNGYSTGWTIEHGELMIGLIPPIQGDKVHIKYLRLIEDTGLYPVEWVELLSWELAAYCCGRLTQDTQMLQLAASGCQGARQEYQAINLRSAKPRLKTQAKFNQVWRR